MIDSDDFAYQSAVATLGQFRNGELSPRDYLQTLIDRYQRIGAEVNAFADTYFDEAMAAADRAAELYRTRPDEARPLEGLPVAIKDETPVAGRIATEGTLLHDGTPDDEDAVVVERIRNAGAIIFARTTTPEFCVAPFTHSRVWGVTRNPWNTEFSPGGSSGGAGAALAAGLTPLADGSDIGGSIRIPASFSGVVGFKPPYGRVPGVPPYNLDHYCHQGPMARTVADCALLEDIMAGPDPRDVATVPSRTTVSGVDADVRGVRIAVSEDLGGFNVDAEIRAAVRQAAARFKELGATVEEVTVGWTFDEVKLATRAHFGGIFGAQIRKYVREHPDKLTAYARDFPRVLPTDDYAYLRGLETEARIHAEMARVFGDYDLLIGPALTTIGFTAGEDYVDTRLRVNGTEVDHYTETTPTLVFNVASRNPVITVPVCRASNNVPIGIQIAGRPFDDRAVFAAAAAFERQDPWYVSADRRPNLTAD
ncbi:MULTISPECIES: amidase [unclassified Mycolicibacterium]|uniref:amidase n=1 Tax=unclassified Mycolicibacterium TaxID=2636767 RepID=UPI0012DE8529|nr:MULTISPECIES: amidase [unclassified Mycolicibacterium]MUL84379.1 amidase [Mycolicibacterium sp. CBMA 329]MUL88154.1 amidase [Mycolicibacterium sp. CBMA 331]MUM02457.1 amidase [Mycolicibacterium sp. CBMA 334]MUM26000.1 amidase [Mycolicibacterium sp. CBMA 295]MUM39801.1 amidase [Mycolicibacterium sp. CBMA 247]